MKLGQIQSCGGLSVAEFHERCVAPSVPVVLKGYAGDWPALRLWSFANLRQQFGQEYACSKDFKKKFRAALLKVRAVYPDARIDEEMGGLRLYSSPAPIPKSQSPVARFPGRRGK